MTLRLFCLAVAGLASLTGQPIALAQQAPRLVEPTIIYGCEADIAKKQDALSFFRPVVSADGSLVIFESTPIGPADATTDLVIAPMPKASSQNDPNGFCTPVHFVSNTGKPGSQRADWCWDRSTGGTPTNGPVAFSNSDGVFIAHPDYANPIKSVPASVVTTEKMIYPAWYPKCDHLAVDVLQFGSNPEMRWFAAKITASGSPVKPLFARNMLWSGFPSVNQANPEVVALAGQPNGTLTDTANYYNQDTNYIWVVDGTKPNPKPAPLEWGIKPTLGFVAKYQARAGWWSPDGKWFAFESNRNCNNIGGENYAIFIIAASGLSAPMQVSDCGKYSVQHPKWLPAGANGVSTKLIAAVATVTNGTAAGRFSIGVFDVANLLSARPVPKPPSVFPVPPPAPLQNKGDKTPRSFAP